MIYLNIKNKWKIFLTIFIGKILLINTSAYSCEDLNYEKAIILIETQSKTKEKIVVELADTTKKRKQGLQCRNKIPKQEGMLFIWKKADYRVFWMKKTYVPLDIIFLDQNKQIIDFFLNAKPMDQSSIISNGKAKYVLEINAGEFKNLDLKLGQKLNFFSNLN